MFPKEKMVAWCLIHAKMSEQLKVRRSVNLILIIVTKRAVNNFHCNIRLFTAATPLQALVCLSWTKEMAFSNAESGSDLTCLYRGTGGRRAAAFHPAVLPLLRSCSLLAPPWSCHQTLFFSYCTFIFLKTRELAWAVSEQNAVWTVDWMTES